MWPYTNWSNLIGVLLLGQKTCNQHFFLSPWRYRTILLPADLGPFNLNMITIIIHLLKSLKLLIFWFGYIANSNGHIIRWSILHWINTLPWTWAKQSWHSTNDLFYHSNQRSRQVQISLKLQGNLLFSFCSIPWIHVQLQLNAHKIMPRLWSDVIELN